MKRTGILLALGLLIPLMAAAQLKVGYLNPTQVLVQLDEYKALEGKLKDYVTARETEYGRKMEAFQTEVTEYQKRSSTLSEAKRKEEEARLATKRQELAEAGSGAQADINRKQQEMMKPLFDRISAAIKQVATEQKLDFVFNQATNGGDSILLYVDDTRKTSLDITQKVLEKVKKP